MKNINLKYYDKKDFVTHSIFLNVSEDLISFLKKEKSFLHEYPFELQELINKNKKNIVDFFDFSKDSEVLLVNDCFGNVSNYLCEKVKDVTILEFSKLTAEIVNKNLSSKNNFKIFVGKPDKVKFDKKFDYIILNDVLEFAEVFFYNSLNPEKDLLNYFQNFLKPDGRLILEVKNRFGIDNWAGKSNNLSKNFNSLCNYKSFIDVKSFSKKELDDLFEDSLFENIHYFYPIINHNDIQIILSDNLPVNYYIENNILSCFEKVSLPNENSIFKNSELIKDIIREQKLYLFTNSFLVVLDNEKHNDKLYSKFSDKIVTSIVKERNKIFLEKTPITNSGNISLENDYDFYENEKARLEKYDIKNIHFAQCKKVNNKYLYEFVDDMNFEFLITQAMSNNNQEIFRSYLKEFQGLVYYLYPNFVIKDYKPNKVAESIFGSCELKNTACIENANINLTLGNIFKNDNKYSIINYAGFYYDCLPLNYILASAIFELSANFGVNYLNCLRFLNLSTNEILVYKSMFDRYNQKRSIS